MAPATVVRPVAFCTALLLIGLLTFVIFSFMDRKLDKQLGLDSRGGGGSEEEFKVSDLKYILSSKVFWIIAFLCVLYYSAIFPFQRFATGMLESNLGITNQQASDIFRWFPMGAMILTPLLGWFLDHKGKGATMLMIGAILMFICHMTFALVPLTPAIAFSAIILLGLSFSLVPAALWPSVPKLVDNRYMGSAYATIFWIQNLGLMAFPMIIGWVLNKVNPGVGEAIKAGEHVSYNYTVPMLIFASLGVLAFLLAFWLKLEDRKKHYGLELPNIKK